MATLTYNKTLNSKSGASNENENMPRSQQGSRPASRPASRSASSRPGSRPSSIILGLSLTSDTMTLVRQKGRIFVDRIQQNWGSSAVDCFVVTVQKYQHFNKFASIILMYM